MRQVFFSSPLSYRFPVNLGLNFWIQFFLSCGDVFSTQLIFSILYKIWNACNVLGFQQKPSFPVCVAYEALGFVQEYNRENPRAGFKRLQPVHLCLDSFSLDVHFVHVDAGVSREGFAMFGCIFKNQSKEIILVASRDGNGQGIIIHVPIPAV